LNQADTAHLAPEAFDLAAFEAAEVGVLDVLDTAGEPLLHCGRPVRIHLYGPGSAEFVRITAKLDAASQARTFAALRGKANKGAADEQRADQITKLVHCTREVENFPVPGGARSIYENPRLGYITAQVQRFLDDWANFPPQSAQS
jgi:hypothetical protein